MYPFSKYLLRPYSVLCTELCEHEYTGSYKMYFICGFSHNYFKYLRSLPVKPLLMAYPLQPLVELYSSSHRRWVRPHDLIGQLTMKGRDV